MEPNCSSCPLNGSPKVYGEGFHILQGTPEEVGSADPRVLLKLVEVDNPTKPEYTVVAVGMAPAEEELAKNRVFVGISGQILRCLMVKLGYKDIYICNSLLCPIPEDWSDKDERRATAIECCKERLLSEIGSRNPRLILALGAMPMEELLGDYSIIKVAGRVFPVNYTKSKIAPVLPTLHPAFIWRNDDFFYDLVEQLDSGIRWLDGTYLKAVEPQLVIAVPQDVDKEMVRLTEDGPSYRLLGIDRVLDIVESAEIGSLDVETTTDGFFPFGREPDRIRCLIFSVDNKTSYIIPGFNCSRENPYWREDDTEYENLLFHPRIKGIIEGGKWRFWNGPFDLGFLNQIGIFPKIHFDGMLAHYTLDEREYVHSLKRASHKYLGAPDWEDDIREYTTKKKDTYDKIPNSKLFWYGAHDGIYTNQVCEKLEKEVGNTWFLNNILLPAANMFSELRIRGVRVDPRELMKLDESLEIEVSKSEDELAVLCGEPVNPNSPQEVMELLYDKLGFKPHPRYGRTSNKKALALYKPHPIVEKVEECRHLSKLKSTYVESLARFLDNNYHIHPFTSLISAVTGRVHTSDPALMNIAKRGGIMRIYIPEPGHKFLVTDAKQMELRCGAIESGDAHLKEILLDPTRDPHGETSEAAFGPERKLKMRGPTKTVVFGRFYGRGWESVMYQFKMSKEEAIWLVEFVDEYFPGAPQYQTRIRKELREKGYLTSYFGRIRRFGLLTKDNIAEYERQGYNFPIQSMGSDLNLLVMLHMYELMDKFKAVPLWPIHDAILFDIEDTSVLPDMKKEMEGYAMSLVKGEMAFPYEFKLGDNWGDAMPWKEEEDGQE